MKNAIRLLALAGALLSVGALAQASQTWQFGYPSYAYIYTNTNTVTFDLTDDTTDGTATVLGLYDAASLSNLESCIGNLVGSLSVTANGTPSSEIGTCTFAPSGVTRSGYTVDWSNLSDDADGSLLIVNNTGAYDISVSATSLPTGATLMVAPKLAGTVADTDFVTISTTSTFLADEVSGYNTQYNGVYVVPLSFAASIAPSTAPTSLTTYTVTYTVSAQ
ncbi:hypothetical protein [Oceanithermus sp.]